MGTHYCDHKLRRNSACLFMWFILVMSVPIYAFTETPAVSTTAAQQKQEFKFEDLKLTQKQVTKIPTPLTLEEKHKIEIQKGPTKMEKVDLVSSVKAFYDEARTMPVESMGGIQGKFHLDPTSPKRPEPYFIFFVAEVRNVAVSTIAAHLTNSIILGNDWSPETINFTTSPVNLDPGETAEYEYKVGPVGSIPANHSLYIEVVADDPQHISEDHKGNNHSKYAVKFVWP
jgi:hypothetical protein